MKTIIESLQHDKIKHLNRLATDNRFRKKQGVFIVEGVQENQRALTFSNEALEFYICESIFSAELPTNAKTYYITDKIYQKIAYRGTTEGIIGVYKTPQNHLDHFIPSENASVIIVESIEKPGNLGAILRSCEAFGIEALIVTDPKVDFYNPNVIRSSVGCLFGMNIFQADNQSTLAFLKKHHFKVYTTFMSEDAQLIHQKDFKTKTALIFGTEHSGISDFWKGKAENILVPMTGTIDSLNLSNAVAVSCYEILRQRL
ncbi:RNA methyltransferase [Riemerella anatipestifer]|uniref:TrmH family RNA methyltransferase n=1 Tax=Riemerella anatipestifer TaxID=34085 RepID=UPI00210B93F7|nr:TrmH family RNA methyltransferase [Riemerella anatipestifer]MCQ4040270.1 RNA methyltransferase [Riemerella anatipestifer]MCU7577511.1 RNA methyltransferase [Riemerella anatipestifer]MDR7757325.1 TrmH family RNA methyltransferase [Riemerella anatipestifer]MDR7761430.1 TrmH family RNA methyltransferase [Riemerella anatipestifer]MDR7767637.1 TrmH family RNA methyltransferase [Riemerella anatipestifer]